MTTIGNLTLTIGPKGESVTLAALTSKGGNEYHALTTPNGKMAMYGKPLPALGDQLPVKVQLDGVDVYLSKSLTDDGREKASYSGALTVRDTVKNVRVSITKSKDKTVWNVVGKVLNIGNGGRPVGSWE
jgi:hypothetical protein